MSPIRIALIAGTCSVVVGFGLLVRRPASCPELPCPPLPSPNGYDDLVAAAGLLTGGMKAFNARLKELFRLARKVEGSQRAVANSLSVFREENAEPLAIIRVGLDRDVVVPPSSSLRSCFEVDSALERLMTCLWTEASYAAVAGLDGDAASASLDLLKLGVKASRGARISTRRKCIGIQSSGINTLGFVAASLTPTELASAVSVMEDLERSREPLAHLAARERHRVRSKRPSTRIVRRVLGWLQGHGGEPVEKWIAELEGEEQNVIAEFRACLVELAILRWRNDRGANPERLSALVPEYLSRVPVDPITGREIGYTRLSDVESRVGRLAGDGSRAASHR